MHTEINADGEHVLWEVGEGHSVKSDRLHCLTEQLGQQKAASALLTYTGSVDSGWNFISLSSSSFCDVLRLLTDSVIIYLQDEATSKTLM